jgi:hypothetical protein
MSCYSLSACAHMGIQYLHIYIVLNHQNVSYNNIYQETLSSFRWVKKMLMKLRILSDPRLSLHQRDLVFISSEDGSKDYIRYGKKEEIKKKFLYLFISRSRASRHS